MKDQMTVAAFYAETVIGGRAIILGTPQDPRVWLTRVDGLFGRVRYCLCKSWIWGIELVDGDVPLSTVTGMDISQL